MKLISDTKEEKFHNLKKPGSYEWWYFDAVDSKNEFSFVAIFLTGNPFSTEYNKKLISYNSGQDTTIVSPLNYCGMSFNLYYEDRVAFRIMNEYPGSYFLYEEEKGRINLDKCSFTFNGNLDKFFLNISFSEKNSPHNFKAEFEFIKRAEIKEVNDGSLVNNDSLHFWQPSAPVCDVKGKIKLYKNFTRRKSDFTGTGYHDHNWGSEPLYNGIEKWYWGRFISEDYSLIYYYSINSKNNEKEFKRLLLFKKDVLIADKSDFSIKINHTKNYWMLNYNSKTLIESDNIKIKITNTRKLDNGPIYMRFLSAFDLTIDNKKVFENATGISEYLLPGRMKSGLYMPFLNMRINKIE